MRIKENMSKNIYVDSYSGNTIAALAEEGKLLEYHIEKRNSKVIAGSIFKGVVENVIDGMQAAFVNVGLDKNGYLYAGDMLIDNGDLQIDLPSTLNLQVGDEVMVQAIKDPFGSKGVRLSTHLSFAGRYLVFTPGFDVIAVSRKITDEQIRNKLTEIIKSVNAKGGFILRTAAETAKKSDIVSEANYLVGLYNEALAKYATAAPGEVVYSEGNHSGIYAEIAFQYNDGYTAGVYSYCNNINTHEGGMHEDAFRYTLNRLINTYARNLKVLKDNRYHNPNQELLHFLL